MSSLPSWLTDWSVELKVSLACFSRLLIVATNISVLLTSIMLLRGAEMSDDLLKVSQTILENRYQDDGSVNWSFSAAVGCIFISYCSACAALIIPHFRISGDTATSGSTDSHPAGSDTRASTFRKVRSSRRSSTSSPSDQ